MADEIVLPRSGIVMMPLTGHSWPKWRCLLGDLCFEIADLSERVGHESWWAGVSLRGSLGGAEVLSRGECISWLDSRVLELRAALMPADTRERIARALRDTEVRIPPKHRGPVEAWYPRADAILSALAGDVTPRPESEPPHGGEEAR